MNLRTWLAVAVLAFPGTVTAQSQPSSGGPPLLLSGSADGLPWGLYSGGLTDLRAGENRLRLSAPVKGAQVQARRHAGTLPGAALIYPAEADGAAGVRRALDFAVDQLQRQGFDLSLRVYPPGGARALLRRTDRLIEVRVSQRPEKKVRVLYLFRQSERPERLLSARAPSNIHVYAAPIDLKTVQVEPGQVFLTPPNNVLIDLSTYRAGRVILQFYGNATLDQLEQFYLTFFRSQGFVVTAGEKKGRYAPSITNQLSRADKTYTLKLTTSKTTSRSRVTLSL